MWDGNIVESCVIDIKSCFMLGMYEDTSHAWSFSRLVPCRVLSNGFLDAVCRLLRKMSKSGPQSLREGAKAQMEAWMKAVGMDSKAGAAKRRVLSGLPSSWLGLGGCASTLQQLHESDEVLLGGKTSCTQELISVLQACHG
jgi:hypothetical protein